MSYTIKYKCGKKVVFESLRYVDLRCTNLRGADLYGACRDHTVLQLRYNISFAAH